MAQKCYCVDVALWPDGFSTIVLTERWPPKALSWPELNHPMLALLMMQKLMISQAYENTGLANTQMVATLFDGTTTTRLKASGFNHADVRMICLVSWKGRSRSLKAKDR